MSADDYTRFQFNFRGVQIEISGNRLFVDEMYQEVMRDIEAARRGLDENSDPLDMPVDESIVWVHRCGDMMRKIYMASIDDVGFSLLSNVIDPARVSTLYVEKRAFDEVLPRVARDKTLWAELTEKGRQKINESLGKKE